MSEILNTGSDESVEKVSASGAEALAEMSGDFDPDKARTLAAEDAPKAKEETSVEATIDAGAPEKAETELTPESAAREYLSLLDELSQGFTNPFYGEERSGQTHHAPGMQMVRQLGSQFSDNPHYRSAGYDGTEAGANDGTIIRMGSADTIIENEIKWRAIGEEIKQVDEDIALDEREHSDQGRIRKFLHALGHKIDVSTNQERKQTLERQSVQYIQAIEKELAISYNEKGDYDYNGGDRGVLENEARNREFFGLDDEERYKKVERAIAIRKAFAPIWAEEK